MKTKIFAVIGAASALVVGMTGCSSSQPDAAPQNETYEFSRTIDYTNMEQLEADSDLVVTATISDEFEQSELNGFPVTHRVVTATETHKGELPEVLIVQSIGTPEAEDALVPGSTHMLFLTEFELEPGVPTGEYIITGIFAGDFILDSSGSYSKVDSESPALPEEIETELVTELVEQAS